MLEQAKKELAAHGCEGCLLDSYGCETVFPVGFGTAEKQSLLHYIFAMKKGPPVMRRNPAGDAYLGVELNDPADVPPLPGGLTPDIGFTICFNKCTPYETRLVCSAGGAGDSASATCVLAQSNVAAAASAHAQHQ
jgi:hypothetical protein